MEEAEKGINNDVNMPARKISVNAGEIIKKFKSFKDRQMFCREMSNYIFLILRFIFPE